MAVERRESVSDIVSTGEAARRDIRASIAAIGWVRNGSVRRSSLYVFTILVIY